MSSISYAKELTPSANNFQLFPPTLQTDLVLPPCNWNEDNACVRTAEQEKIITEIYLGYTLAMKHRQRIEKILQFDNQLKEINEQMYYLALTIVDDQSAYTDHLMERIADYEKQKEKIRKKNILYNILWGTAGAGVGTLIVGIITISSR